MNARFVAIGGICAFLSVAFGAFGAHMLKDQLTPAMLTIFQTGVQYQMMHSLGLIGVGLVASFVPDNKNIGRAGWCMLVGIILFSGSLYVLSFTGVTVIGAVTPLGGVAFLLGWLFLVLAAVQYRK
jgi:uncharacterized membrane protein YgdD (TMEM256/DUF423 family)